MAQKVIGFDIDDVVYDFHGPLLKFINDKLGTNHKKEDLHTWDIDSHLGINRKLFKEFVANSNVYKEGNICKNFLKLYNSFKSKGYKVIFISSRFDLGEYNINTLEITKNWLEYHGIKGHIEITDNKQKAIIDYKVDLFIDDGLHNIVSIYLGSKNKDIKLFLLDKPWNGEKEIERLKKKYGESINEVKFKRIKSLDQINSNIFKLNKKRGLK